MSQTGQITIYSDARIKAPTGIISGLNRQVWFTSLENNGIGSIDPFSGHIELFFDPDKRIQYPANIYEGLDQCMWFTCVGSNHLVRFNPTHQAMTLYSHPEMKAPVAIKRSADGRIWFSCRDSNAIGCIDTSAKEPGSTLQLFQHAQIMRPAAIYATADNKLIFLNTMTGAPSIGMLDCSASHPEKSIVVHPLEHTHLQLRAFAQDRQGYIWNACFPNMFVKYQPHTFAAHPEFHFYTHADLHNPDGLYLGKDETIWFVNSGANSIGRFNPSHATPLASLQLFSHADMELPFDIKPAADGNMWFTNKKSNTLGKITVPKGEHRYWEFPGV